MLLYCTKMYFIICIITSNPRSPWNKLGSIHSYFYVNEKWRRRKKTTTPRVLISCSYFTNKFRTLVIFQNNNNLNMISKKTRRIRMRSIEADRWTGRRSVTVIWICMYYTYILIWLLLFRSYYKNKLKHLTKKQWQATSNNNNNKLYFIFWVEERKELL